jgi:tetratricopeptide (TPR) repeat protein
MLPVFAVFVIFAANGQAPDSSPAPAAAVRAQKAYDKANALFEQKRLRESVAALDEALAADPKHVPALTLKAKIAISSNRLDIAGECLHRAVAADPSSWYARFLLGFWYYLRNDSEHALTELNASRKLNPKDSRAPLYLGMTYERLGDTQKPLIYYGEALRLEEAAGEPDPYTLLAYARLLLSLGRLEDCTKTLNRALKLYPKMRDVQYEFGLLLLKKGDAKRAAEAGEAALLLPGEDDVTELQVRYLLTRAYQAAGQDELAAKQSEAIRTAEAQQGK